MPVKYNPKFFEADSIEYAKKIILMGDDIPDQWETETNWTMNFFRERNLFDEKSIVLDWGCGIGRLAKPIIEEFDCRVVGVDFQPSMLKYATEYVNHSNFTAINNEEFEALPNDYFTAGISVWALQHTVHTVSIINCIQKKLKFESKFCVLDSNEKHWPVQQVKHQLITSDDIIFNIHTKVLDNVQWISALSDTKEILDYFSVEEIIAPLSSKNFDDTILSKHLNGAWGGVLINNKKYYFYGPRNII